MARALGEALEKRGWEIELHQAPRSGLPILQGWLGPKGHKPLLFLGHLDTVLPATPPGTVGEELVGTGALDMKGGWATLLGALDLLSLRGAELPLPLALLAVPDEEVGGPITHEETARMGAQAREVWVLEPGERTSKGETLVLSRRGRFSFHLRFEGRAAHSGLDFWQGRSAVVAASAWVCQAHARSTPQGGGACTVNVARLFGGTSELRTQAQTGWQTWMDPAQTNVVPDLAELVGEARFRNRETRDRLAQELSQLATATAERYGVRAFWQLVEEVSPFEATPTARKRAILAQALAAASGWELELDEDRGGVSFPNFLPNPGIPVLDGLGPVGVGMHTREERVSLLSLARRVLLLADLLAAVGKETSAPEAP
jgi:glutamate carboxypeptidase